MTLLLRVLVAQLLLRTAFVASNSTSQLLRTLFDTYDRRVRPVGLLVELFRKNIYRLE